MSKTASGAIVVHAQSLQGLRLNISRNGDAAAPLANGHDAVLHLQAGDRITVEVEATSSPLADLDAQTRKVIADNPQAGPDLTDAKPPRDPAEASTTGAEPTGGAVTSDTGATRTRSTRAS
jgi:hypothetical protein